VRRSLRPAALELQHLGDHHERLVVPAGDEPPHQLGGRRRQLPPAHLDAAPELYDRAIALASSTTTRRTRPAQGRARLPDRRLPRLQSGIAYALNRTGEARLFLAHAPTRAR